MSIATNYMTHLTSAAEGYIQLEATARGLADELYQGLVLLADTVENKSDLLSEFDKAMIDVEKACKEKVIAIYGDPDMTMSKVKGYKNRKSEIRRGLKAGLDPAKFQTFSKFRKGTDAATGGNATGSTGGVNSGKGGGAPNVEGGSAPMLHSVTSSLSEKVKEKISLLAKHIEKLDEATALKVLQDCDGQIHKLAKAQARFGGARTKTA